MQEPRLTQHTQFSGCGAKLGPGLLDEALCGLKQAACPDLIADFAHSEDAGLYRIAPGLALVQTVDFFPPIVDDPFLFGRIAAANALSDVYAMGGRPLTALALVSFPVDELPLSQLRGMMEGGLDALAEAGCTLLGGHSIEDREPKLGYSITGSVEIGKEWRNNSLRPGLAIILTKALGTGIVNMALREGIVSERARIAAEASMRRLNRRAAEILAPFGVAACTDVTGFGLGGHAAEMASGEVCGLRLRFARLRFLPDVADYAARGLVPGGARKNREGRGRFIVGAEALDPVETALFYDPQTSGGLLAALPADRADEALAALLAEGHEAAIIGESGGEAGKVKILR